MSNSDPEIGWISRCARGDEGGLKLLVEKYQPLIFGIAKRYLGNAEDAEEVAISTFLKAWNAAERFRRECSAKAFLCQIALNICRDRPKPKPLEAPPCLDSARENSEFDRLMGMMQMLPTEDREVLIMYYLDELSYQEICDSFGVNYDVLKTRLVRARKRLRTLMEITDV